MGREKLPTFFTAQFFYYSMDYFPASFMKAA